VHRPQHTCDELVDAIAFLHKRNQCRDSAFIVGAASEMGKDELLESIDLILKRHEIRYRLVTMSC
jgi:hypothetical protein